MQFFGAAPALSARIVSAREAAEGVLALELADAGGAELPDWQPGAHIDVQLPGGIIRQYSLCGDPDRGTWRLGVLLDQASRGGSRYIHENLREGTELTVSAPRNNFALEEAERYIFVAGGIGITPILPMLRAAAAANKPWTLIYGGRSRRSMAFLDEIPTHGGDVHIVPQDEQGHPDLRRHLGNEQPSTLVYCCGPEPLIKAVEDLCASWSPKALRRERFAVSHAPAMRPAGSFVVELARSGQRIVVDQNTSLLKALEDEGYAITNSCRAGICGTCLVKVLGGVCEHNDDILSDEQRESNTMILPCVSRSRSQVLVLDL